MSFILYFETKKHNKIQTMKYIGIIMIVIGALVEVLSYVTDRFMNSGAVDQNWVQGLALLLIIAGLITHIRVTGKSSKA
jgi:EamA domain-containing membrane protein RarD